MKSMGWIAMLLLALTFAACDDSGGGGDDGDGGTDADTDADTDTDTDSDTDTDTDTDTDSDTDTDTDTDTDADCPEDQILCGTMCVDPLTDNQYCGASGDCTGANDGEACASGYICDGAGACALTCQAGLTECDGTCVDLDYNPENCGACGTSCALQNSGVGCVAGDCYFVFCEEGFADCDGEVWNGCEIDLMADRRHCGACEDAECPLPGVCTAGECVFPVPADGFDSFAIVSLSAEGCTWIEHEPITGDDNGGIAVTPDYFYYSGDNYTGRFDAEDLDGGVSMSQVFYGIVTDIATGTLYSLGDGDDYFYGGTTISQIHTLDPEDGAITATRDLGATVNVTGSGDAVFAGPGFALVWSSSDTDAYKIMFADGGVTDLDAGAEPEFCGSENWADWGVAERFGGEEYMVYNDTSCTRIVRTRVSDGETETILSGEFSDLASMTILPSANRWYWHYESQGELGGGDDENAGFCDAVWSDVYCGPTMLECGGACVEVLANDANCGACGNACGADEHCNGGVCETCLDMALTDCSGVCADLLSDPDNCGVCGTECSGLTPYCINGTCGDAAPSCADYYSPGTPSGVYTIAQEGEDIYQAYCLMDDVEGLGGGWTLLAVFTNDDGENSWSPFETSWVTEGTFGDPTDPSINEDAKSVAFDILPVDELLIVRYPDDTAVITNTGCVGDAPLLTVMQRDSESDGDCAYECETVFQNDDWGTQDCQTTGLRFRCSDDEGSYDVGGYRISQDDNSFITTLDNASCESSNFGLGAGESSGWPDWDNLTSDSGDDGDTTQILLYGR